MFTVTIQEAGELLHKDLKTNTSVLCVGIGLTELYVYMKDMNHTHEIPTSFEGFNVVIRESGEAHALPLTE